MGNAARFPLCTLLPLAAAGMLLIDAPRASGAISDYSPDIDVSAGTFNYFFNEGDNAPTVKTGAFFCGYLNMKSPLFTFFFNTKNVYSTYEAGLAFNKVDTENYYVISIPITLELSYRIPLFRRVSLFPFFGTGFDVVNTRDDQGTHWNLYYLFDGGMEVKYAIWRDTFLKVKVSYGIVFVNSVTSGYVHFLKIRFPIPFIP